MEELTAKDSSDKTNLASLTSISLQSEDDLSPDDIFSPSIADNQKVGFFRQDKAAQTEKSDIVELKEMSKVLQTLMKESKYLKRELDVARQVVVADYENKIEGKAIDMYTRVNERLGQLENTHQRRVEIVRRSYRTQLSDAIARISSEWKKYAHSQMSEDARDKLSHGEETAEEHKQLKQQVVQQENVIQMLKMQLEQQAQESHAEQVTPSAVHEAEHLKGELGQLQSKIDKLEDAIDMKDEAMDELRNDIDKLNRELEKEKARVKQLQAEMEEQQANALQEMSSLRRTADKQRMQMEKEAQDKMKQTRVEMLNQAKGHATEQRRQEEEKTRLLEEQRKAARALKEKEKAHQLTARKSEHDLLNLQKTEQKLRTELTKQRKQLDHTHRMWEKKFAILQKSLYAIKDESYLRQTLQKQAAALRHVSVSYAADRPFGMLPADGNQNTSRKSPLQPLPGINRACQMISPYTMSPPPDRGVDVFSVAESQILEANEYYDGEQEGFFPIPSPPPGVAMGWRDGNEDSLQQRVAVTPTG